MTQIDHSSVSVPEQRVPSKVAASAGQLGIGAAVRFAINTRGNSDGWCVFWERNPYGDIAKVDWPTYCAMTDRRLPGATDGTIMADLSGDSRLPQQKVVA